MEKKLSVDLEEYNILKKSVIETSEKLWKIAGYPTFSYLNIPKDMVADYNDTVHRYAVFVLNELYEKFWEEDFVPNNSYELLPPWYFAPRVGPGDIFWRMGFGETYCIILNDVYLESLTEEQKRKWEEKYPEPCFYKDEYLLEHSDIEVNRMHKKILSN